MSENQKTINVTHVDVEDPEIKKKNLWFYPLGTVGRDMVYTMFTSFISLHSILSSPAGPSLHFLELSTFCTASHIL